MYPVRTPRNVPFVNICQNQIMMRKRKTRPPVQLVLLHTWGALTELEPLFELYRSAPILLAHAGAAEPESYVAYARKYPNLYLELCFSGAPYGVIEYFVHELGSHRMLFGSDSPYMSIQQQLGRVLFADIAEDDKKAILIDNPKRILGRQGI